MNNVVMRKIDVSGEYQPLSAEPLILSVDISAPPTNSAPVFSLGDGGSDVPWIPGEYHTLQRVNLAEIQVKGIPGDCVTLVGGTW